MKKKVKTSYELLHEKMLANREAEEWIAFERIVEMLPKIYEPNPEWMDKKNRTWGYNKLTTKNN